MPPGKGDDMVAEFSCRLKGEIGAGTKKRTMRAFSLERPIDEKKLDGAILSRGQQRLDEPVNISGLLPADAGQQGAPAGKIHRPAIVGVHQAKIPELRSLIEIRHTGRGDLDQGLREGIEYAEMSDSPAKRNEFLEKFVVLRGDEDFLHKRDVRIFVGRIGL